MTTNHTRERFAPVEELVAERADEFGGVALCLTHDSKTLFETEHGRRLDELIPVRSAAKWPSVATIASVIDDDLLSLDDRIVEYLPRFDGEMEAITVRNLLSHTSGLPSQSDCVYERSGTLADCVDEIADQSVEHDPGSTFDYGAVSFHVAGRVAEVATDEEWSTLFNERIADPLGMAQTHYVTPNPRIAGGMHTTATEYRRFLEMMLNEGRYEGRRIIPERLVDEILMDQTADVSERRVFGDPLDSTPWPLTNKRYGLGMWRERVDDSGQLIVANSIGGGGFIPWIDLERELTGVLAVNDDWEAVAPVYREMKARIRDALDE